MKFHIVILSAILCLATAQRIRCESFCRFRFCAYLFRNGAVLQPENRAVTLGVPNDTISGVPCLVTRKGIVRLMANVTGGEATVSKEFSLEPYVPISEYRTDIVDSQIPPNFFLWVPNLRNGRQSVGRLPPKGNQDEILDRVCVRMPISSYNLLRGKRLGRRTVQPRGADACVGFRTQSPKLLVTFEWGTSNDFDLRLEEPNGFEINRFGDSKTAPSGGHLVFDVGGGTCQIESGKEMIRYLRRNSVVELGTYTIRIDHLRLCSDTSPYRIRVFYDGEVIFDESGELMQVGQSVLMRKFTIPPMDEEINEVLESPEAQFLITR